MIIICRPDAIPNFLPDLKKLVETENARGDCLIYDKLAMEVLAGRQQMALVYTSSESEEPIFIFLFQEVYENIRDRHNLVINHMLIPDRKQMLSADHSENVKIFRGLANKFDEVIFFSNNPRLAVMLESMGIKVTEPYKFYSIVKE